MANERFRRPDAIGDRPGRAVLSRRRPNCWTGWSRTGRRIFGLMMATYRALLRKIARRPADGSPAPRSAERPEEAATCRPLVAAAAAKGCAAMIDTSPKCKHGNTLPPSLALRTSVDLTAISIIRPLRSSAAGWRAWPPPSPPSSAAFSVELFEQAKTLGGRAGSFVDSRNRPTDRLLPARRDGLLHRVSRLLPPHGHRRLLRAHRHAALHRRRTARSATSPPAAGCPPRCTCCRG